MSMPQVGDAAPAFSLHDQSGRQHDLSAYAGKQIVLYFYPKDDTPGCTVEACSFRDEHSALEAAGAVVLGVSPDDTASHEKFAKKFSLNFPLLADVGHAIAEAYGVWGEKSLYGRKFQGVTRATFLIGPDGKIARVWPKVSVNGHVAEVRAAITGEPVHSASLAEQAKGAVQMAVTTVKSLANSAGKSIAKKTHAKDAQKSVTKAATAAVKAVKAKVSSAKKSGTAAAKKSVRVVKAVARKPVKKVAPVKQAAKAVAKQAVKAVAKKAPVKKAAPLQKAPKKGAPAKKAAAKKKR